MAGTFDLSAKFSAFARLENLSDEHYEDVYGYATPGRTIQVGLATRL
ncbi:MAG: hypothetical protein HC809_15465 [Gammaproteobacteria bacterium]|nr:hypothetical protein [Gammaproteobacteria bacterium]